MHTLRYLVLPLLVLSLIWSSPAPAVVGTAVDPAGLPTDQIILRYESPESMSDLSGPALARQEQRLSQAAGVPLSFLRPMSGEAQVWRLSAPLPVGQVEAIARRLAALPEVAYAEPDLILQPMLAPNDPQYGDQWHYFTPSAGNYGINAPAAWDLTTGSAGVVSAVIDTGITAHAEFSGRTVPGYDFISAIDIANDGDGWDGDPSDPGDWCSPYTDSSWHGTHTAGTVGAASNNNQGVAGVNWKSKILPVRVLGKCGGTTSDVVDGMRWAAGLSVPGAPGNPHPAKVINLSLGGPSDTCGSTTQNAVDAITAAGVTVVVSAGNNGGDAGKFTPGNCNKVITVAATNREGSRAYYSNYGPAVEISAPGGETFPDVSGGVLSTSNTGLQGPEADMYQYEQGTSMSAPHVTGVVSLLYSLNPGLLPAQVVKILRDTATRFPAGSSCDTSTCGSGIVNAGAAVLAVTKIKSHSLYLPINQR